MKNREHLYRLGDRAGQWLWKRWSARRIFAWLSIVVLLRLATPTPALADVDVIGIGEATEACGPGAFPVLERIDTIVVIDGGRVDLVRVPTWSCAPKH